MLNRLRHAEKLQGSGGARTDATKVGVWPWALVLLILLALLIALLL